MALKVKTAELSPVIKQWIVKHNINHPIAPGVDSTQGKAMICKRAGITQHRLQSVLDCTPEEIDFELADKILCAIDLPGAFNSDVSIIDDSALLPTVNISD